MQKETREITVAQEFDSFVWNAPPPGWHRALDSEKLAKHLPVFAVADTEKAAPDLQKKLLKFRGLLNNRKVFFLRPALRDEDLRHKLEIRSSIWVDFDELQKNEAHMKQPWLDALKEQGFQLPAMETARPANSL